MQITYDKQGDVLYIQLSDDLISGTRPVNDFINVDLTADGKPAGVELLRASWYAGSSDELFEQYDIKKVLAAEQDKPR